MSENKQPTQETTQPKETNQTLHWSPEAKIEITGLQFDVIQKTTGILEQFLPALIQVRSEIWKEMVDKGLILDENDNVFKEPTVEEAVLDPTNSK